MNKCNKCDGTGIIDMIDGDHSHEMECDCCNGTGNEKIKRKTRLIEEEDIDVYYKGFKDGVQFCTDAFNTLIAKQMIDLLKIYKEAKEINE